MAQGRREARELDHDLEELACVAAIRVPPARKTDGTYDAEHYRARIARANAAADWHVARGQAVPFNLKAYVDQIVAEANTVMRTDALLDTRTPEEKMSDFSKMLEEHPDALFEMVDADLDAMEAGVKRTLDDAAAILHERGVKDMDAVRYERRIRRGKALLVRLGRIRRTRELARNRHPEAWARLPNDSDSVGA